MYNFRLTFSMTTYIKDIDDLVHSYICYTNIQLGSVGLFFIIFRQNVDASDTFIHN